MELGVGHFESAITPIRRKLAVSSAMGITTRAGMVI
jgi:hypothetical protein